MIKKINSLFKIKLQALKVHIKNRKTLFVNLDNKGKKTQRIIKKEKRIDKQ